MVDLINAWKSFWHPPAADSAPAERMPLTEKDAGEPVPYPYPLHKVQLDGDVDIAYVDEGPREAPVLVFVHGMGAGIPAWRKNLDAFTPQFRCIALDLPGHGYSAKGDYAYTVTFYADVVLAFLRALGLESVTLIGHSLGGQTTIVAALREPALIGRTVLIAPAGVEPYTAVEKQLLIRLNVGVVASGNAFTKNKLNFLIGFGHDQEMAGDLARRLAFFKEDASAFGRAMQRAVEGMLLESVNHVLHELRQPCLLLVGQDDKLSPYQYLRGQEYYQIIEREAAKLPRGRLVVVPHCGHFVQYQCPEAFNRAVLHFLSEPTTL